MGDNIVILKNVKGDPIMSKGINSRKVAMIGTGFVGSSSAFALMESGLFTEMVLIDADKNRAEGEALDIAHGLPFARPMKITAGDYDDIVDAAIIVVTAGAGQKPGETRLNLVKKNVAIFQSIIPEIAQGVKNSAYKIIEKKKATYYGVAMAVRRICEAIIRDEKSVLPVSSIQHDTYGIEGVTLSMPAIVGKNGIEKQLAIKLNEKEQEALKKSAEALKEVLEDLDI